MVNAWVVVAFGVRAEVWRCVRESGRRLWAERFVGLPSFCFCLAVWYAEGVKAVL